MVATRYLIGACITLLLSGDVAQAAPAVTKQADAATLEARKLNARAKRLFSLGLFAKAAEVYERAYVVKAAPAFLYNLGQCYRRLDGMPKLDKALFYFESFLRNAPASRLAPQAKRQLRKLKKRIARLKAERDAPPPIYKRWWFWTAIGVVVAGATTATVIALQPDDEQLVPGTLPPGLVKTP
jgi:tetratricopeptide (TPR) repeat protein